MNTSPNFRSTGSAIRLGLQILSVSYKTLHTEKLRNSHAPSNNIRTAWPTMLIEFADLIGREEPTENRVYYSPEEIQNANEICDIYSKLPYTKLEKKITLIRARTKKTWREIATQCNTPWEDCRRTCDTVILHLVQVASLDKYKDQARQAKNAKHSKANIYLPFDQ